MENAVVRSVVAISVTSHLDICVLVVTGSSSMCAIANEYVLVSESRY